ncbi:hypothetical protein G3142_004932 [Salmonella enterica subsp. enterica serovar Montevideo]|nr:hypothetical protein [Salmonella enterica subsp. enterica serovar Montevideo]EEK7813660.1 hypothetical protein [Salmonella enterica subsp. enterica serovar Montevideo]
MSQPPEEREGLPLPCLLSLYLSAAHRAADFCYHFFNPEATGQTKNDSKNSKR